MRKCFVVDTSVFIQDPEALFAFGDNNVCIPSEVFREIDGLKRGLNDIAQSARRFSRLIDDLISSPDVDVRHPIPLGEGLGHLLLEPALPRVGSTSSKSGDSRIIHAAEVWAPVADKLVVVSKDVNLRIQAKLAGLEAEDYYTDRVVSDASVLGNGMLENPGNATTIFTTMGGEWDNKQQFHGNATLTVDCWPNAGFTVGETDYIVDDVRQDGLIEIKSLPRFTKRDGIFGVRPRSRGQRFALNALMDPNIDVVALLGGAGTGKTLMALAAGLELTVERKAYREVMVTRAPVPLGGDIGFLPGTESDKMLPWMGAIKDNMEFLADPNNEHADQGDSALAILSKYVSMPAMSFMRGRTLTNRFVILDEAQNLSVKQTRALLTRAGEGTKVVLLGNLGQIDTPYLTETSSGLTWAVRRIKGWKHGAFYTLEQGERSRLSTHFEG